ncbi:histone-lysine N-methyltransferase SETDB2-like isoform X3 [Aquila chrysaetos chrysaetos]|uniref:histone-lysine N-methyltransferase SETDB2-like isoform X3 n=1 Tax=Aquila chrysaetos chrysaetos TaxID=223781 RepID=UPI001B7D3AE6|nr:histone-lysine N-methyltransferase SETDB2-like isoform X3 [Aquila chrysaetos chrysaetos]
MAAPPSGRQRRCSARSRRRSAARPGPARPSAARRGVGQRRVEGAEARPPVVHERPTAGPAWPMTRGSPRHRLTPTRGSPPPQLCPTRGSPPPQLCPRRGSPPPQLCPHERFSPPELCPTRGSPPPQLCPHERFCRTTALPPREVLRHSFAPTRGSSPATALPPQEVLPRHSFAPREVLTHHSFAPTRGSSPATALPPQEVLPRHSFAPREVLTHHSFAPTRGSPPPQLCPHKRFSPTTALPPQEVLPRCRLAPTTGSPHVSRWQALAQSSQPDRQPGSRPQAPQADPAEVSEDSKINAPLSYLSWARRWPPTSVNQPSMQLSQKMEEKKMLCDCFEVENLTSSREERTEGDLKTFWTQLGGRRVDVIFEQVQNVLLLLKQKIKNGTATNQECWQAWALVNEANLGDLLTLTNVSDMFDGDGIQETKPKFQRLLTDDNTADSVQGSHSKKEEMEKTGSGSKAASSKIQDLPLNLQYQNHKCSSACLANRAAGSYKGENPLKMPILFDFQRRHAKADCLSKSLDVNYKAPCGRSLRSFQDVQNYLFETECNFLFVDHFSFNTYVLLGRNTVNPEPLVFDFDISNGAESVPVSFCNDLDRARLPYFKYRRASWPRGYYLNNFSTMFVDSCDCTDGCIDRSKCACLQLTARGCSKTSLSPSSKTSCGYSYKRLEGPVPSGIYECSVLCRCDKMMCQNRVVQHGIQVRLQVFNTEKKGWGVRCLDDIDKGTFVCTYSGRLMSRAEVQVLGDAGQELKEKSAVNDRGHGFFSKKRKLDSDCSDSVIELVQTGKNDILEKQESLSQTVDNENKSTLVHPRNLSIATSRRPGTKTVVFHNHHLKMNPLSSGRKNI